MQLIYSLSPCSISPKWWCWRSAGNLWRSTCAHVSHLMTNYHKRGGLTVISAMTFQNGFAWGTERRVRKRESRGLMAFRQSSWGSTWDLLLKKETVAIVAKRPTHQPPPRPAVLIPLVIPSSQETLDWDGNRNEGERRKGQRRAQHMAGRLSGQEAKDVRDETSPERRSACPGFSGPPAACFGGLLPSSSSREMRERRKTLVSEMVWERKAESSGNIYAGNGISPVEAASSLSFDEMEEKQGAGRRKVWGRRLYGGWKRSKGRWWGQRDSFHERNRSRFQPRSII